MTTQATLWTVCGAALAAALLAAFAEHRRGRRRDLDRPGWVPWTLVQLFALLVVLVSAALALKTG